MVWNYAMSSNPESQEKIKPALGRHGTIIIPELQVYKSGSSSETARRFDLDELVFFGGGFDVEPIPAQKRSPTPLSASFLIRSTIP